MEVIELIWFYARHFTNSKKKKVIHSICLDRWSIEQSFTATTPTLWKTLVINTHTHRYIFCITKHACIQAFVVVLPKRICRQTRRFAALAGHKACWWLSIGSNTLLTRWAYDPRLCGNAISTRRTLFDCMCCFCIMCVCFEYV